MNIKRSPKMPRKRGREIGEGEERIVRRRRCGMRQKGLRVHAIQQLFAACRVVFGGPGTLPASPHVEMIRILLDKMKPEDVGLSSDILFFKASNHVKGTPRITYTTMYSCDDFSMCLFFLPPKAVIPLHNHPGMTVFNKLLLGSMHIKSYDWVDPVNSDEPSPSAQSRLARVVVDSNFTSPCNTSILYPASGGNIHTFTAITPCIVLDVMGPPYSIRNGRDCTYYKDHPCSYIPNGADPRVEHEGRFGWLEEIEIPKDLKMDGIEYLGPRIIDG